MPDNNRQQRMVERILEDERLRGDLEDDAASALIAWASERADAAAADPARPDDAVESDVQAVRQAARAAVLSGETDPQRLVAVAEAQLSHGAAPAAAVGPGAPQGQASPAIEQPKAALPPSATAAPGDALTPSSRDVQAAHSKAGTGSTAISRSRRSKRNRLAKFLRRVVGQR
jgi:hypothetical protein